MKNALLLLAITACACLQLHAQPAVVSDLYRLGTKQVRVPEPEGFINAASRYDEIVERLYMTEDPRNETIASFVPQALIPKLDESQHIDLPLYAKFSVPRTAMAVDLDTARFQEVVATTKALFPVLLDPNGKFQKDEQATMVKNLQELWGKDTTASFSDQKKLGYFQDSSNVFSALMAMNFEMNGKIYPLIYSSSFLLINKRIIFLFVYKTTSSPEDTNSVMDMTRKWTAAVIAANPRPRDTEKSARLVPYSSRE